MRTHLLAAIIIILLPFSVFSATSPELLRVKPDARTAALGEAFTGVPGGMSSILFNPAGTSSAEKSAFSLTHFSSFAGISDEYISFIMPIKDFGVTSGCVLYDYLPEFKELDENGGEVGTISSYDIMALAGYSRKVYENISAGINLKIFYCKLYKWSKSGAAVDFGVQAKIGSDPDTYVGASIMNIGGQTAYIEAVDNMPSVFRFGIGFIFRLTTDIKSLVTVDFSRALFDRENPEFGAGAETSFQDFFKVRLGYVFMQYVPVFTAGLGITAGNIGISYALQPFDMLGVTHRFSLDYTF